MAIEKKVVRIFGLDVIRFIAIFFVLLSHTSGIFKLKAPATGNPAVHAAINYTQAGNLPSNRNTAINTAVISSPAGDAVHPGKSRVWILGVFGVELFFVLSGFLIGNILIKQFIKNEVFTLSNIKEFLMRRWLRTLPNYWFVLTLLIISKLIIENHNITIDLIAYYFFVQNLFTPHPLFFSVAWSLAVEEWFYLTIPFTIWFAARIFKHVKKQKLLLYTFSGYALFFIIVRCINAHKLGYEAHFDDGIRQIVVFRLDAIMYGVIIALLMRYRNEKLLQYKKTLFAFSMISALSAAALMFYLKTGAVHYSTPFYKAFAGPFDLVFLYTFLPMGLSLCLPYASACVAKRAVPGYFEKFITYTSKISYSIYLIHYPIYSLIEKIKVSGYGYSILLFGLYLSAVYLASAVLYKYIEQPVLRFRDKKFAG